MSVCQSCGGVIGRDCFNPRECAEITGQQAMEWQQTQHDKQQIPEPRRLYIYDIIELLLEKLDFDAILRWAELLGVEVNYPPLDDMWPDWQDELTVEVGEAMRKV